MKYGIDARDMESVAVGNVCKTNNIELVIIKGITDFPGDYEESSEEQYLEYKSNIPKAMDKILREYLERFI